MQDNLDSRPQTPRKRRSLKGLLFVAVIVALWIWGLNWLFSRYASDNYFVWYIKNGSLIGMVTAFIALVWRDLEELCDDLVSWHPAAFFWTVFILLTAFYKALADVFGSAIKGGKHSTDDSVSIIERLWDLLWALIMGLFMFVPGFFWLLVISPLFYLLTLFTGAPARVKIRDPADRSGQEIKIVNTDNGTEKLVTFSFGKRPFVVTNALNAAVLFLIKAILIKRGII